MTANCSFPALVAGIAMWQIVLYLSKMGGVGGALFSIYVCVYVCVCFAQCVSPHVFERVLRYTVNL